MSIWSLASRRTPRVLLLLIGFWFLIGVILLSCFGPVKLACNRVTASQVRCTLSQFVAFGLIKAQETTLDPLKLAKVDQQVKHTVEVVGDAPNAAPNDKKELVYGVLLISQEETIFNGYSYNREYQQQTVEQINQYLNDATATRLVIQTRNYWLDLMTVLSLGLPMAILLIKPAIKPASR